MKDSSFVKLLTIDSKIKGFYVYIYNCNWWCDWQCADRQQTIDWLIVLKQTHQLQVYTKKKKKKKTFNDFSFFFQLLLNIAVTVFGYQKNNLNVL